MSMQEVRGDIWDFHKKNKWVAIPVNGFVKNNGEAVMGAGTALQAANRHPSLPKQLGTLIREKGNHVHTLYEKRIFTFPVKRNWWEEAELFLIRQSAAELAKAVEYERIDDVYMPRPGCGNGRLQWVDVKPILEQVLDGRFTIVEITKNE